jgi:hypothetical protein
MNINEKEKNFCWSLILIVAFLVTGISFWNYKNKIENIIWKLKSTLLEYKYEVSDWEERKKCELNTEGVVLPDSLQNIIDNNCVLRLHDGICMSCFAENLSRLLEIARKDTISILILGNYMYKSSFKEDIKLIGGECFDSMNLLTLSIIPADSLEQPYLFDVDVNGKIQNVFFVSKDKYELGNSYLNSIANKRNGK